MEICYFGTYERTYPRNSVVISGLRKTGAKVIECHVPLWEKKEHKAKLSFFSKIALLCRLPFAYAKLFLCFRKNKEKIDCIIVGYIGQIDMLFARLIAGKKKIIFNPMISLYDTLVNDRKIVRNPLLKKFLYWLDKKSCNLADLVLLDTEEHAKYFRKEFRLKNVGTLYMGADEIFKPLKVKDKNKKVFKILYYGKYTPLHGTQHVIEAAKILEKDRDIMFEIIGKGQTYKENMGFARKIKVKNIKFTEWISFKKLPEKIAEADVCLGGHFGSGNKARRVVPNKVFHIIAMAKPVVVNGGPAIREAGFKHKENCLFVNTADASSIADSIILLKKNSDLRNRISKSAYNLYKNNFSSEKIAKGLIKHIKSLKK